jgi:hypothetical protein
MVYVALGVLLALAEANQLRLAVLSRAWPSVPGQIAQTAMRDPKWSIGRRGRQDVLYHYKVEERYYVGTRKSFIGLIQNWWRPLSYEAGADVVVRHHPTKSELAVLEPGVPLELAADYVVSAALIIFGTWLWLAA